MEKMNYQPISRGVRGGPVPTGAFARLRGISVPTPAIADIGVLAPGSPANC